MEERVETSQEAEYNAIQYFKGVQLSRELKNIKKVRSKASKKRIYYISNSFSSGFDYYYSIYIDTD